MLWGICGYASAGKDTAADYLVARHDFVRVAFADKLREFCLNIDPWVVKYKDDPAHRDRLSYIVEHRGWDYAKREYIEVREFLQSVGHAARITFGDTFWIERALTSEILANERIVVTDVRYQNEADYISSLDGFIVRIEREGVGPVNDHITEQPLPFDYVVKNPTGSFLRLQANLDELVRNISTISS